MKFSVPQFIDVEDKIFLQLTLKQAIYLVGSFGFALMVFLQFGFFIALIIGGPVLFFGFMLAFVKLGGRPFISVLSSALFYLTKSKLYLWKKEPTKKSVHKKIEVEGDPIARPTSVGMTQSKLKQLAWTLDTNNMFDKK